MRIMKLLAAAALIVGLSSTTNATLEVMHYYSGADGGSITNDLAGSAHGTLHGVSTNTTDAVVTDGGAGTWASTTNAPPQGMVLPSSVVTNMGVNAWTISTWVTVESLQSYATDIAISDGTTANFILAAPQAGRIGNANYVTLNPPGASWPDESVTGNDVDIGGPTATVGEIYNKVLTYDGSTATLYINGERAGGSGDAPDSVEISGIDMRRLPHFTIGAGSPWGDGAINGSTHAFAIFGEALTEADVADLYKLSESATLASVQAIGNTPFKFQDKSPTGAGHGNDVILSVDVKDNLATFSSASMYLNGFDNGVESSANTLGSTTTVTSVEQYLAANSTNTVSVIAEGNGGELQTNNWEFIMGDQYAIVVSPEKDFVVNEYSPEVSVTVVDVADTASVVELIVDGVTLSSQPTGSDGTTTVSSVVGPLAVGQTVNCQVVVASVNSENVNVTEDWSFTMGGGPGGTIWDRAPELGDFDIAQTNAPGSMENNIGYSETETDRHEWSYISSGDRPAQGQTFITPANDYGFEVTSIWIKNTSYEDGGNQLGVGSVIKLRITDPSRSNTVNFVRSELEITNLNSFAAHTGQWIQLRLPEKVVLRAGTTYGYDVTAENSWFNTAGVVTDPYAGGTAYRSGDDGAGNDSMEVAPLGDRSFIVQLAPSDEVFVVNSATPKGTGILNLPVIEVEMAELGGKLDPDSDSTKILLDGVEQYVEILGAGPEYTLTADLDPLVPSTTHEAACIIVSSSPAVAITNTWTFTMEEGFFYSDFTPSNRSTQTNETVSLSATLVEGSDFFKTADLLLDGGSLGADSSTDNGTTTVSAVSGVIAEGKHIVDLVVNGQYGGEVTKRWEFNVKLATTDRSWNINIAGPAGGTASDVADGTIVVSSPSGQNIWNNLQGNGGAGVQNTNNFEVVDTNGGNPIGFYTQGQYNWGDDATGGDIEMTKDLFMGWYGASANHDAYCTITGLNTTAAYDIYLYSTWTHNDNATKFEIIEGTLEDPAVQSVRVARSAAINGSADDYSSIVEGRNYVLFKGVTPDADGNIKIHSGFDEDCVLSGLQIREHAGEGDRPVGKILSLSPLEDGTLITDESVTLEAVILDYNGVVNSNGVTMLLNGSEVDADILKVSGTTTVSFVASDLPAGRNVASVVPADEQTNSWEFFVSGERIVPIDLKHHWNFMDGAGTTVKDVEGGLDGTIMGSKYAWLSGGGLNLKGGGNAGDWNDGSGDGSYVDLPNGLISQFGDDSMTIEAVYNSVADSAWQRVFSFGGSVGGEDQSPGGGGDECVFLTTPNSGGNTQFTLRSETVTRDINGSYTANKLTHVVWEYDSATRMIKMYLDGELVDSDVLEDGRPLSELIDVNNWIGRSQWQWDGMFEGKIYDLRFYSGLMTDDEAMMRYYTVTDQDAPIALVKSMTPEVSTTSEVELKAIMVDFGGILNPDDVTMLLDGAAVAPTADKVGTTTTVSYVTSPLALGKHAAIFFPFEGDTNTLDFIVGNEVSVPTTPVYHWDFKDGSGTNVKDVVGGQDGAIYGTNYKWVADGGLSLLGGGSSDDWNNNLTNIAGLGSYVDMPNGILSVLDDEVTIEITYSTDENTAWLRVFDFGGSNAGEDLSDSASNNVFLTSYLDGGIRVESNIGSKGGFSVNSKKANIGEKNHVVWVYDASGHYAKLYQNGVLVDEIVREETAPMADIYDVNNWIGRSQWTDVLFAGTIYDMRIYNGIMTATEVSTRYQDVSGTGGSGGNGPVVNLTAPAGGPLTIMWPLSASADYNVMTNADLTNPSGWGVVDVAPVQDGDYYTVSIEFGEETSLFYKLESTD
jgi:hypothetical protein